MGVTRDGRAGTNRVAAPWVFVLAADIFFCAFQSSRKTSVI
jgi:hypothetical protein